jgi:uncharacterized protein
VSLADAAGGHFWTIGADLAARVRPQPAPVDTPWTLEVREPKYGHVRLGGRLRRDAADTLVVVVHGLGGNRDSPYMHRAARAIAARGWSCLRLDMRGADGLGEDYYHAALTGDLHATLAACPEFERVFILGYSLGGHVTLRYGIEASDPRVEAIAAVCAPLDLAASAAAIDRRRAWLYRAHILRGLARMYREVAQRREVVTSVEAVARVRTIREWDDKVVAPRHGFASADDYYARASVGPRLAELRVRAAWFGARHDPMVTAATVLPSLAAPNARLSVHWIARGGHVGFPEDVGAGRSLEAEVLEFFSQGSRQHGS